MIRHDGYSIPIFRDTGTDDDGTRVWRALKWQNRRVGQNIRSFLLPFVFLDPHNTAIYAFSNFYMHGFAEAKYPFAEESEHILTCPVWHRSFFISQWVHSLNVLVDGQIWEICILPKDPVLGRGRDNEVQPSFF